MDQCQLLSHRHLPKIFHFFYSKCTSQLETITGGSIFLITSHHLYKITSSLTGHFKYYRPVWIMTVTCADSSNNWNDLSRKLASIVFNNIITNLIARPWVRYYVLRNYATVSNWMKSTFVITGDNLSVNANRIWSSKMDMNGTSNS